MLLYLSIEISAKDTSLPVSHTDLKTIGRASCPFYAAFRIVVQAFNNSPRFVLMKHSQNMKVCSV
jgi:hypothetical protein